VPAAISVALESFLDVLRCPTCCAFLHPHCGALRCRMGHTFNLSRHGYVSLLTGPAATSGDDATMVLARDRFLATGGFEPIRRTVAQLADTGVESGTVVEVGCGTGYYLAGVLDHLPVARGLGLDTSARALRAAAHCHDRAAAASSDVFRQLPLADAAADVVLDVFAPRNPTEFRRVLRPGGRLVVVRPTGRHLLELREHVHGMVAIDPAKEARLRRVLAPFFEAADTELVEYVTFLPGQAAVDLVGMTPSARHLSTVDLAAGGLLPNQTTVSVLATVYRPS
jgi:23S rRNA (guanine745-N1)-methyltransferase